MVVHSFNTSSWRGSWVSKFKASLDYSKFQDKPGLHREKSISKEKENGISTTIINIETHW